MEMILTRKNFNKDLDYGMLKVWWNGHGSHPPKPEHLSSTGIIVEADGKPACLGFLYRTDSRICWFDQYISNPESSKTERDAALQNLIEFSKEWAKSNGYNLIYTSVGIPKYIKRLKGAGFLEIDKEQSHLFYEVDNEQRIR